MRGAKTDSSKALSENVPYVLAVHHHVAMANLDWLYAALLGIGGSILGGAMGGWYALRATHQHWEHERKASQRDRSHQAAAAILVAVGELEQAIVAWQKGRTDADALRESHNSFVKAASVQSTGLTDDDLRARVGNHRRLAWMLAMATDDQEDGGLRDLSETVRFHADAVSPALEAHVRDNPLPPYQAPPLDDAKRLLEWRPPS
jgi:hypothetical protein